MGSFLETYVEIQNEVLNYGFDDGPQVYRSRVKQWINEGEFQIAREVEGPEYQEDQGIPLVIGTYKYELPNDFLRVQDVYYPLLGNRLRPVDLQQFDMTSPEQVFGPPAMYTLWNKFLWIFPTPSSADQLLMRYLRRPPTLVNDADVPLLNGNYLHLLVMYAVTRAFEAEDDYEAAQYFEGRYRKDLAAYATDVQARVIDRPRLLDGAWMGSGYSVRGLI